MQFECSSIGMRLRSEEAVAFFAPGSWVCESPVEVSDSVKAVVDRSTVAPGFTNNHVSSGENRNRQGIACASIAASGGQALDQGSSPEFREASAGKIPESVGEADLIRSGLPRRPVFPIFPLPSFQCRHRPRFAESVFVSAAAPGFQPSSPSPKDLHLPSAKTVAAVSAK